MSQYRVAKMNSIIIGLLMMLMPLATLQPALAAVSLPLNTTTPDANSTTLLQSNQSSTSPGKNNVTLRGLFTNLGDPGRWTHILQPALDELNRRHPDMNIQIQYVDFPYNETRNKILDKLSNGDSVDIVSVDQIWLGEFAEKGLIRNLTDAFDKWGGVSRLYEANVDGCVYNSTIYGLWLWTDVRGIWYWKDMLQEAGIDPGSLKTWDGYISAAVKLNDVFAGRLTQGAYLWSGLAADMWYPYLWMLGGDILELREGHPTKGVYWFPSYNSSEGVKAMEFLKRQIDAGIKPQETDFEKAFVGRKYAVMPAGSWMPGEFPRESWPTLEQKLGFIPMFPVPNSTTTTSTMMSGWELAVPSTSQHSDLSWE